MYITLLGRGCEGGENGKEWFSGQDITIPGSLHGQNHNVVGKPEYQFLMIIKRKPVPARMNTTVDLRFPLGLRR